MALDTRTWTPFACHISRYDLAKLVSSEAVCIALGLSRHQDWLGSFGTCCSMTALSKHQGWLHPFGTVVASKLSQG